MLTATAMCSDGTSDQVNFTVADPGFIPPPLTVTEAPNLATQGNPLTFTANLAPPGPPPTTGTITWTWLVAPAGTPACPASSVPPLTATCTVSNAQGGQQYEVEATYAGDQNYSFISAVSPTIYVWPPTQLAFTSQPPISATDGSTWPTVQVSVQDLNGDLESSNGDNITLALSNPPPGAILSCAGTQPAINGLATFSGCSFTGPIGSYHLTATDDSESLPVATSGAVSITLGPPDHLKFTSPPPISATDDKWLSSVHVSIEDIGDNPITTNSTDNITLGLSNPPPVLSSAAPAPNRSATGSPNSRAAPSPA